MHPSRETAISRHGLLEFDPSVADAFKDGDYTKWLKHWRREVMNDADKCGLVQHGMEKTAKDCL